jgi:hypothetical protein
MGLADGVADKRFSQDEVNRAIGKKVKEVLNLENLDENDAPRSHLIQSYTRHKV